ncbi:mucin-5AC-like isoform X3 [Vespa crabro]|uniref:mucin-5AC-like isoform X3 n=1 Tax=Vespa crabro TaxID=7445 RepID=UPI001F0133B9|nr:mucin-5AC-like isoform X3 [Vespa crabro]
MTKLNAIYKRLIPLTKVIVKFNTQLRTDDELLMRCNVLPFQEVRTLFLLLTIAVLGTIQDGLAEKKIVCYYTNWSIYRPGTAKFSPQNINPYLCTHLIYAFGGFTKDNALKPFDKYQDIEKGGYAKFTGLKTYNKNLKTMLAIGGWNEGSSRFSPMLADPTRRKELVKNSIKFLRQNHFDGLDLDWEYPAFRDGGKPHDKNNYANFVQELYEEFERESKKTGRARLLLSMAMPAGIEYIDKGYDVPRLNEYLDFINLLSYDYHSAYEPAVNHHAPLYPLEEDNEYNYDSELTINYTINHLMKSGASSEKIILGIPTYGRSYTLFNEDATDLGSPADGPGIEGDDTREKGYLSYYEICEGITNSDDWEVIQPNPKAMGPYAFKGNQWVGYDDVDIVRLKARFINEKNLGGIMFWSIDNDDFRGKCHNRPYPLIEAGKETLLIEDTRNVAQKPKSSDSRKKLRGQGTPNNSIRRKVNSNVRRSTTSAPVTRKQVTTSRTKYRTIARTRFSEEEEDREVERRSYDPSSIEEKNESGNAVRSSDKNKRKRSRNRSNNRNRSSTGRRRKPIRNDENDENDRDSTTVGESLSNKLTTPEPPTTPDPGTDFKCEDEGFYPHPRECKKYFWCLDSGPGGLGLVVYQFTCPAGLVFNKAADSCDYPRNVVCPKAKTPQTTTRAPITAATSRTTYLHSTTQRTTTAKSDSEEEEEYYDDEEELEDLDDEEEEEEEEEEKVEFKITSTMKPLQYKTINRNKPSTASKTISTTSKPEKEEEYKNSDPTDEEDPRVIKELINLIRKAGGIEELEKQLHLQEKGSSATSNNDPVTPATISRTLYERVLNRQASKIINSNVSGSSEKNNYKNGPGRAQFEGLDEIPEVKSLRRIQKPQYVTIERPKASTNAPQLEDEETDDDDELEDYNVNVASSEDETISNPSEISTSTQRVTPNYVNIRRNRFSTTTSKNENDVEEKADDAEEETPIRRRRPSGSTKNQDKESEHVSKPFRTRTRYRNTESNKSTEESSGETDSEEKPIQGTRQTDHEINTATTKSRYINIQRFRSTTQKISVSDSDISGVDEITTETSTIKNKIDREEEVTTTSTTPPTFSTTSSTTPSTSIQSTLSSVSVTPIYLSSSTSRSTTNEATTVKLDRVEDTSIANVLNDNNNLLPSTTTDSPVKLVEESATEILFTTAPASPSPASTSLLTTTRIVATVSQPRPFGFTRRRSGSPTPDVTTTPLAPSSDHSRSKVANSDTPRLPTLKELIGYQTYEYTTPSSVFLNLLHTIDSNEVYDLQSIENDQIKSNVETVKTKYLNEDINETIDKTNENYLNHKLANIFEEHDTENNDIDNKSSISKKRKTRIDHAGSSTTTLKPTTMRGTPIISSTSKTIARGFYVTKGDIEMTMIMHPTTEISMDNINSNITYNETIVSTELIDAENISMTDLSKDNATTDMTTFADTDKEYSEYSNIITKFEQTTPLTMTENITQEVKQNDQTLFVVNNISSDTSKRGRVKYSDVTTSLYRPQTSLITETTVSNILKTTEINKNSETNTIPIDYTLPIESVDTEFDITMRSTISTLDTDTSKLPNDRSLKEDIIQFENFSTTISNIPSAKVTNDQSNIHYIVSDKINEFESTVISDHTLEQETTTIKSSLTTANFKRTLEGTTADRERDGIKMTNIETTTMIAENKNAILNDFDTVTTPEELRDTTVDDKNVYKSNPNFQKVTTLSESTGVPFTTLSNLLPSQIPLTIQSRQEEDIHPRRRRPTIFALNNQFGQRRRTNLERRVTQQYEIGNQPSIREDLNSPKRVLVYRKRQRRPNNTTVTNNTVSNGEVKTEVTENKTRRSKLVIKRLKINRKEYVEEDSVPLEKTNIFQDSPLVTEYTERPVDEVSVNLEKPCYIV